MVVLTGLAQGQAEALGDGNGEHTRATATWLNGVHPKETEGADVRAGMTADQIAAAQLGRTTPLPSLELAIDRDFLVGNCENGYSCVYMNTIAWRDPTTPLPMENNPRVVFEQLFGEGGSTAERAAQFRKDRSILDAITDDLARLHRDVGAGDRARVTQYLDAVRAIERRIQPLGAERHGAPGARPAGRHPRVVRRARQADVRPHRAGLAGGHHPGLHLHAGPRAERPRLPGGRDPRVAPRDLPSPVRSGEAGAARPDQHLPRDALPALPGDAGGHARRRRLAARPRAAAVRRIAQRQQQALALRPAADAGRRQRRAVEGRPSPPVSAGYADDQPARQPARQGGRPGSTTALATAPGG